MTSFHHLSNTPHLTDDPDYFEWWYFHLMADNGWYINFILHATDIFSQDRQSYISLSALTPGGRPYYFSSPLHQIKSDSDDLLLVSTENCCIVESGKSCCATLYFDGAQIQLSIEKDGAAYIENDGLLYRDKSSGKSNYWFVPIPHGKFSGHLRVFDISVPISGTAYHDHNWGTAKIQNSFKKWLWGHVICGSYTIIFYFVESIHGEPVSRAFVVRHGRRLGYTSVNVRPLETQQYFFGRDLPARLSVVLTSELEHLELSVEVSQLFRKREDFRYRDFVPIYYRAACTACLRTAEGECVDGYGITEYLYIEKG